MDHLGAAQTAPFLLPGIWAAALRALAWLPFITQLNHVAINVGWALSSRAQAARARDDNPTYIVRAR